MEKQIYIGNTVVNNLDTQVKGGFVTINNQAFYKISNYNKMPDFFMTLVSVSDLWMFISSNGALTAGRNNRDNAMFPYYSVDKIHDYHDISGSKTIAIVNKNNKTYLWEPFAKKHDGLYNIQRNIYKSVFANKLIFEEINTDLGLCFSYSYCFASQIGLVKQSQIKNIGTQAVTITITDGLTNILPNGFSYNFQLEYSNLLDAYKKNELITPGNIGIFTLSSVPVDRAEPSEALKATTVWSTGLINAKILLSVNQLANLRLGKQAITETDIRATRGAYFLNSEIELAVNTEKSWLFVADVNLDTTDVANLKHTLSHTDNLNNYVQNIISTDTEQLKQLVAKADGLQKSGNSLTDARHFANSLFNIMRGGIFNDAYMVHTPDFINFVNQHNKQLCKQYNNWFLQLPQTISIWQLKTLAGQLQNNHLKRLCAEYLPLTFSRRHGDPSRPWNRFDISPASNTKKTGYQGNWRDIFQNWEALALSYPAFAEHMVTKFVNSSTPDGYNPYRVSHDGFDWECPDPDDAWAFIGYWGDHQVIYLQKLVEILNKYYPGELQNMLDKNIFVYANVPYRIKSYNNIIDNPRDTIEFDYSLNNTLIKNTELNGSDAKLVYNAQNNMHYVTLTEKLLVMWLAKITNFIPDAGIWLNTQRPEWNDANNALVGNGTSMVTLYYLRRSLAFWDNIFAQLPTAQYSVSVEVYNLLQKTGACFGAFVAQLNNGFKNSSRRMFADTMGQAASDYRSTIYNHSFSGQTSVVTGKQISEFLNTALAFINQSIKNNMRADGLYNAYNLVNFSHNSITISYLNQMLEGQVAILSSGFLSAQQSLVLLDKLRAGQMYNKRQNSYLLYPDKVLPLFCNKNNIDIKPENIPLVNKLIEFNNTSIIKRDKYGNIHFNGNIRNAQMLANAIDKLDNNIYGNFIDEGKAALLNVYEQHFNHHQFTGRSGTFFAYEGLGSIYWHMVSKLLLAVNETIIMAYNSNTTAHVINKLIVHYSNIKDGIGLTKTPEEYGAFPIDPYSHTPAHAGAQQPGMTGQVKEDIITRFAELGVFVNNGIISFSPALLNDSNFSSNNVLNLLSTQNNNSIVFTVCGTQITYIMAAEPLITVNYKNGQTKTISGNTLCADTSKLVFNRDKTINNIIVNVVVNKP